MCGGRNRRIDSSHFRGVRGVHGVRLSDRCALLKSIANPHVILRRQQCLHMYTHSCGDVQHCPAGIPGVRGAFGTFSRPPCENMKLA
ncbi:hypothetical protein STXM2123_5226 [Streptomyces sp. F-3]|nr:hypothetical protein STXM2123_5226 [Streptomyces sp. F-3]